MIVLRHLDVVLVVAGAAIAIALGAPALGCAVGAGGWIVQTVIAVLDTRWTRAAREPGRQVGRSFVDRFGRIWLLAGAIVVAAVVGGRTDGLAAALAIFFAYSVAFAITIASGPPPGRGESR
ncbi:MAG TPA: hypothetical protein VKV21_15075 [Solirubrobacteraceae bacterium]|nr:hypothetical protein [Solirubrobacteraceae bacterium]